MRSITFASRRQGYFFEAGVKPITGGETTGGNRYGGGGKPLIAHADEKRGVPELRMRTLLGNSFPQICVVSDY